jgi:hypothetical protein
VGAEAEECVVEGVGTRTGLYGDPCFM